MNNLGSSAKRGSKLNKTFWKGELKQRNVQRWDLYPALGQDSSLRKPSSCRVYVPKHCNSSTRACVALFYDYFLTIITSSAAVDTGTWELPATVDCRSLFQSNSHFRVTRLHCFPPQQCHTPSCLTVCLPGHLFVHPSVSPYPQAGRWRPLISPRDSCPNKTLHSLRPLKGGRQLTIHFHESICSLLELTLNTLAL